MAPRTKLERRMRLRRLSMILATRWKERARVGSGYGYITAAADSWYSRTISAARTEELGVPVFAYRDRTSIYYRFTRNGGAK